MEEIKIYYDQQRKNEVIGLNVNFPVSVAGQITKRKLYIFNNLNFKINLELSLDGQDIKIIKNIKDLIPKQLKEIEFELSPKLTTMKPVTASLKIKLDYVVR